MLELKGGAAPELRQRLYNLSPCRSRPQKSLKFHVVVVHGWQRNAQKSVMHVQSCCFAN